MIISLGLSEKNDPKLAFEYFVRSIASLNLRDYEKGIELANLGIEIVKAKPDSVPRETIALLYQTKGTALSKVFDFHQSIFNYKKALGYYEDGLSLPAPYYLNMLSNMITSYYYLGQFDECSYYFMLSEKIPNNLNTIDKFDNYFNYSSILAERNMKQKGVDLLTSELNRVRIIFQPSSRDYNYALQKFAGFLLEYKIDPEEAFDLYKECYKYLIKHPWDLSLRHEIALGYSTAIAEKGNYLVALDSVRSVLYTDAGLPIPEDYYTNPPDSELKADKVSFDILYAKYRILRMLFNKEKKS